MYSIQWWVMMDSTSTPGIHGLMDFVLCYAFILLTEGVIVIITFFILNQNWSLPRLTSLLVYCLLCSKALTLISEVVPNLWNFLLSLIAWYVSEEVVIHFCPFPSILVVMIYYTHVQLFGVCNSFIWPSVIRTYWKVLFCLYKRNFWKALWCEHNNRK